MDMSEYSLDVVMKNIYSACDPQQSNQVRAYTLIEYIKPYLQEDREALDKLRLSLDPENENICLTSEKFYEVLGDWAKQVAATSEDEEQFNRTPNHLEVMDEKLLPFIQSTPRASFGDKLLRSEAIINLSNVPPEAGSFNLSGLDEKSSIASDKVKILEENIKYLEHQLSKITSDAEMIRAQLLEKDEQNENLQLQLERLKTRLNGEKQMNEHLQKTRDEYEEIKDEMSAAKKEINSLNKKLLQYERDFQAKDADLQRIENENANLVMRCKKLTTSERELMEEIIDLKEELNEREHRLSEMYDIRNEMGRALQERNNTIEEMTSEYEILNYKRNSLEKVISSRRYSAPPFSLLSESVDFNLQATSTTIPIYSPNNSLTIHETQFSPATKLSLTTPCSTPKKTTLNKSCDLVRKEDIPMNKSRSSVALLYGNRSMNVFHEYNSEEEIALASCLAEMQKNSHSTLQNELLQASKQPVTVVSDDKEIFKKYQDQINVLQHEKESLINKLDRIIEENNVLADKVSNLETDLQKQSSEKTELRIEQENKIAELEKQLRKHMDDNNKFNFEMAYKKVQIELTKKKTELEQLSQNAEDYRLTLCKLNKMNSVLEKQLLLAQQELKEQKNYEGERDNKTEKINYEEYLLKLEEECQAKDVEISKLKSNMNKDVQIKSTMFKDIKQLQTEIDKILSEKLTLVTELKDARDEFNKKDEVLNNLESKCNVLENKNSELENEIHELESNLLHINQLYNDEIKKNTELLNEISIIKTELQELKDDYQQKVGEYDMTFQKIEELEREVESKYCAYNQLQSDYQQQITKNHELSNKVTLLEQKNTQIFNERNTIEEAASKNIHELRAEAQSLTCNLKLMNEKYDKEVANNAELHDQLRKLENDMDSLLNSKNLLEKDRDQKVEKNQKLSLQIQQLKDNLNMVSHQHEELYEIYNKEIKENQILSAKIVQLKNQVDFVSNNYQSVKEACELEGAKCEQFQTQILKMNEIIAAASQYELKLKEKNDEIKKLNELMRQFENELEIKVADNRQLLLEIDRLKNKEIESSSIFKDQIKDLHSEIEQVKMENARLKSNNPTTKRKSFGKQEVSMDRLRGKLENLEERISYEISKFEALKKEKEQTEADLLKQIEESQNRINLLEQQLNFNDQLIGQKISEQNNAVVSKEELQHIRDMLEKNQEYSFELERRVIYLKNEISCSSDILQKIKNLITNEVRDRIKKCTDELRRAFIHSKNIKILNDESLLIPEMMEYNGTEIWFFMDCLQQNITTITLFMENLSEKIPSFLINENSSMKDLKQSSPLQLKTTTIKCLRPISPDSPSIEMDESCDQNDWSKTCSDSSQDVHSFLVQSDTNELLMEIPMMDVDLSFREVFPHLTDDFLHQLGLGNESPKKILSEEETEQLFTSFAINIAIDSINIEDRLNRQLALCQEQHKHCFLLIKNIFLPLQDHKGSVGNGDSINPSLSLLQDLRSLLPEIVRSSLLLGMLNCEKRMLKSWNLVTNYMAILKKRSEKCNANEEVGVDSRQHIEPNEQVDESGGNCAQSNRHSNPCRSTIKWFFFTAVLVTALVVSLHFNCKTNSQHLACPLDDFIKKVEIGEPPY